MDDVSRVLITGCAGFIGSHAVDNFLSSGYFVCGVDCLTYAGDLKNLDCAFQDKNFNFFKIDICKTYEIMQLCEQLRIEWIINFAAETHVDNSIESCERFIHSNINGVKSLLECCRQTGIKLLHVSTDEVYGSIDQGSFTEDSKLNPKNPYSATKASAEHLITAYNNTHGVDFLMVRPSNNFGPRQHKEKFIPTILESLMCDKKIPIYGDGSNVRDWLYVKDNVEAIRFILENSKLNETFNVTLNDERSNIETVNIILDKLQKDFEENIEFIPDRPGHDFRYSIDNSKLLYLGFGSTPSFEDHIKETINFFKSEM
jgi:dTDP-glucose 4,6-dehydratase